MLHQTRGIALHLTKFSETSSIVKIYTELFGLQSYLVRGVRKQKSKIKSGLFQPLTLLDLVVYHKEKSTIQSLKEVNYSHHYKEIPFDIRKSSIALFINELLYKSIHGEESFPELFTFLYNSCIQLDETHESIALFHLVLSIHLTRYLGCMPQLNYSDKTPFLDLREGVFQSVDPGHPDFLDPAMSRIFFQILQTAEGDNVTVQLPAVTRNSLLETILVYYRLHVPGFREMKSQSILRTVLG
jgi:DNA repair protein RecO (recombination protein O)